MVCYRIFPFFKCFLFCSLKVKQSRWEAVPFQRASDGSVSRGGKATTSASRARGGHRLGHYRNIFSQRSPSSSSSRSSSRSPSPSNSRYRDRGNQRHRRRYGTDYVMEFIICHVLEIKYIMFLLLVILVHSLIAAFQATSDLNCHDGIRGEGLVVAMTEREDEEIEDVGEEERPTEEDGKWKNSQRSPSSSSSRLLNFFLKRSKKI